MGSRAALAGNWKTARKSNHRRVHLPTQRSALSSEPEKRLNVPLPHSYMGPHNCLLLSLQTFGSEREK